MTKETYSNLKKDFRVRGNLKDWTRIDEGIATLIYLVRGDIIRFCGPYKMGLVLHGNYNLSMGARIHLIILGLNCIKDRKELAKIRTLAVKGRIRVLVAKTVKSFEKIAKTAAGSKHILLDGKDDQYVI